MSLLSVSMARLIAGAANGKPFLEPETVSGVAHLGQSGVDEWAAAVLKFPGGILAEVSCSVSLAQDNVLRILGAEGRIEVRDFWFATGHKGGTAIIDIIRPDGKHEPVEIAEAGWLYSFEAEAASLAILAGKTQFDAPGMSWDDTLGNLRALDKWRQTAGLEFEIEKPALRTRTLKGEILEKRSDRIGRVSIPGLDKPVSQLALGFEDFRSFSSVAILLDAFYEKGGNAFDTAFIYGNGITETLFGDWQASRGVRDDVVVIGKGAHSPLTYPDVIAKQLDVSLNKLKTDHVDVYFMHRDNTDVPVDEFVDAMDAEVRRGRIRARSAVPTGPVSASTRPSPTPIVPARQRRARYRTISHWRKCKSPFGPAASLRPMMTGAYGFQTVRSQTLPGRARAGAFSPTGPDATRRKTQSWSRPGTPRPFRPPRSRRRTGEQAGQEAHPCCPRLLPLSAIPADPLIGPRTLAELDDSLEALDITLTPDDIVWLRDGRR